jgi:hypothetical protein
MTFVRPLDQLVEAVAAQASLVTDVLPGGWTHLYVPGVDRPVVLGPGGVFVLDVRHHSTRSIGLNTDRPWNNDHEHQLSTPRVTAELASQLLTWACDQPITVTPVIVLAGEDAEIVARPDGVDVVHQHMLMRWLSNLPTELDSEAIALIVEHVAPTPSLQRS